MARIYREAPLNSVWEGTANMMCLDVRRAMINDAHTIEALFDEVRLLGGQDARYDAMLRYTKSLVHEGVKDEFLCRRMTEAIARLLQGAELMRHSTQEVVDVFLGARCPRTSGKWGLHYGTLDSIIGYATARSIVQRASID